MSVWNSPSDGAGAAAVAAPVVATAVGRADCVAGAGSGCCGGGAGATAIGSGSRIRALNPLPNAFLGISDNLLGKLNVAFCAFTMYVVEHYRHSVAWSLGQPNISRDDSFKDLCAEKAAKIRRHLF